MIHRLYFWMLIFPMGVGLSLPSLPLPEKSEAGKTSGLRERRAIALRQPNTDARAEDVGELLKLLEAKKFAEMEESARRLTETAPAEARFHYLRAEALAALDRQKEADEVRKNALRLNPQDEAAHALTGAMLFEIQQLSWSRREWRKVLDLPPATGCNEANAHIQLGQIHESEGRHAEAANHLEMALDLYRQARAAGLNLGMQGAKEEDVKAWIRSLREAGDSPKEIMGGSMNINVAVSVKGGKDKEMAHALLETCCNVDVTIEPSGFRMLDSPKAKLRYDFKTDQIFVNEKQLGDHHPKPHPAGSQIAVFVEDCCYIYRITQTSRMDQIARYERDYVLKLTPNETFEAFSGLKDISVKLNGQPYPWKQLQEGIPFDILPAVLNLEVEATNTKGQRFRMKMPIPVPVKQSQLPRGCPGCEKCAPDRFPPKTPPPSEKPQPGKNAPGPKASRGALI